LAGVEGGEVGAVVLDDADGAVLVYQDVVAGGEPLVIGEVEGGVLGAEIVDGCGQITGDLEERLGRGSSGGVEVELVVDVGDELDLSKAGL